MTSRKSPVRGIHFLLAPRMARRMCLWALDNPELTYSAALRWEAVWIRERGRMRESYGWMWRWRAPPLERIAIRVICFRPTIEQLSWVPGLEALGSINGRCDASPLGPHG